MGADITDLTPLSQLTSIYGAFEIRNCPLLTNLNGLHNITVSGNDALDGFILRDLPSLTSLSALSNLTAITGEFTIRTCNSLNTLTGLNSLDTVHGSVIIRDNAILQNFNGLSGLIYIGETLEIIGNPQLIDISALSNVNTIVGGVEGGVFIENNIMLSNLTGLGNNLTTIGSNLDLVLNGSLTLCSVPSICNYLSNPPLGAIITINTNLVNCNTESEILANCVFLSENELNNTSEHYSIFPNPASDIIKIFTTGSPCNVEVYSVIGKKVDSFLLNQYSEYELKDIAKGTYFLKFTNSEREETFIKFIKL